MLNASIELGSRKHLFVGYYDLEAGEGVSEQLPPILAAGHTPVYRSNLTPEDLYGLDVLMLQNPDNAGYGAEFTNSLEAIRQAVMGGMTLILHDRAVSSDTTNYLPGGASIVFTRDTISADCDDLEIRTPGTLVTDGPGGIVGSTTLDGGGSSCHGYADETSLPAGTSIILSRVTATEAVTFAYRYGAGWVVYSTIPLDYALQGGGSSAFAEIYGPNVLEYGCQLH